MVNFVLGLKFGCILFEDLLKRLLSDIVQELVYTYGRYE